MRLTTKGRFAVTAMIDLGLRSHAGPVALAAISQRQQISLSYLEQWFGIQYQIGRYANQAFWTTVIMDVWHWTPFVTLTMTAGLTALPKEPMEQALVDGANRFQVLRFLTIPMMMPVIITTLFIRIMDTLRIVDEVFLLTGGGPADATRYLGILIWRVVFPQTNYGYGSAMSLVVLYMTLMLSWLLFIGLTKVGRQTTS